MSIYVYANRDCPEFTGGLGFFVYTLGCHGFQNRANHLWRLVSCYVGTYRKARAHVTNDTSLRALRYEPPNEVTADAMTMIMSPSRPPTLPSGPCDAAATTTVIGRAVGTVGKIIEKKLEKRLEVITQVAIFAISN